MSDLPSDPEAKEATTEEWLAGLFQLDAAGDYQEVLAFVAKSGRSPQDLLFCVYRLFVASRFQSAYLISRLLAGAGARHPAVFLALGLGGLMFGNAADQEQGTQGLKAVAEAMSADLQDSFYTNVIYPVSLAIVNRVFAQRSPDALLGLLEILKAATPLLGRIFDFSAAAQPYDLDAARQRGRERARLLEMASPPPGSPRVPRRAIVAMREMVFPTDPNSRTFDGGPRIAAAMSAYGWNATHYKMKWAPLNFDYLGIVETCEREQADLLVLDDHVIEAPGARGPRLAMIAALREKVPSLKIMAMHLDVWALPDDVLIEASAPLDAVWALAPAMPVWRHPVFAGKVLQAPLPLAVNYRLPFAPLPEKLVFMGGVKGYNWHRAFWQAAANRAALPIEWRLSEHKSDGLSTMESYALYVQGLAQTGASLNFSMRPNLSRVIAMRSFETVAAGALLIEEEAPDLDYFLVAGEHYLEFSTFAELGALIRFIAERPDDADAVRRAGNGFFRERYDDDKIVGYIDRAVFYPAG